METTSEIDKVFVPRQVDIEWAKDLVNVLKDGGISHWPSTGLAYRIDKQSKTLTLLTPGVLRFNSSKVTHEMGVTVFGVIGYTVKVVEE